MTTPCDPEISCCADGPCPAHADQTSGRPTEFIDVVFDGPPAPESGRFVEVEDSSGRSIRVGEWIDRGDGFWALRIARVVAAARAEKDQQFMVMMQMWRDQYAQREKAFAEGAASVAGPVLALREEWRYKGEFGFGAWQEGHGPDLEGRVLDDCASALRAAIPTEAVEALAQVKAEAWDEGEQAGRDNADDGYPDPAVENPYRIAREAQQEGALKQCPVHNIPLDENNDCPHSMPPWKACKPSTP